MPSYATTIRCRTYGAWPEWLHLRTDPIEVELPLGSDTVSAGIRLEVQTHEARERPEVEPGAELKERSTLLFGGAAKTGYQVGAMVLKAPEDVLELSIEYQYARQGDVDLTVRTETEGVVDEDKLTSTVASLLHGVQAFFHIAAGEWLVAETPPQTAQLLDDGQRRLTSPVSLAVRSRPSLTPDQIGELITRYLRLTFGLNPEDARSLEVGLKRFLDAQVETDPIDRFCDLWEACEFVTRRVTAKGTVVSRIATALSVHMNRGKKKVETALGLRGVYLVRKDIVHNAVERPALLTEYTGLLEDVCRELLRWRLDLPYSGSPEIEKRISAAT